MMPRLSTQLEADLKAQEADPRSIASARGVLEAALTDQLRQVAAGLLADALLERRPMSDLAWWHQYASRIEPSPPGVPDPDDPDFRAFRQSMVDDVAFRRIKRMRWSDLHTQLLRIYGGTVYLWQEGRINRQLAELGSSCRIVVLGSDRDRLRQAAQVLGEIPRVQSTDLWFLFGHVAPTSVYRGAPLFEFARELAIAPGDELLGPGAAFVEQHRIILRATLISMAAERQFGQGMGSPESVLYQGLRRSLLGHEFWHIIQKGGATAESRSASWYHSVRDDLCRFARAPRTLDEIWRAFAETFDTDFAGDPLLEIAFRPGDSPRDHPFRSVIEDLHGDELLVVQDDGRYICPLYREGRRWLAL